MALICVGLVGVVLGSALGPASATTQIQGHPNDMKLRAENASIREILDALSASYGLNYQLPPHVTRNITGLYSGTLDQVLARILDGNDYVLELSEDGVKVVVVGVSGDRRSPAAAIAAIAAVPTTSANDRPAAPSAGGPRPPLPSPDPKRPAPKAGLPILKPVPPLESYLSTSGLYPSGGTP